MTRPSGFWTSPKVVAVLQQYLDHEITSAAAAAEIDCPIGMMKWYAGNLKAQRRQYAIPGAPTYTKKKVKVKLSAEEIQAAASKFTSAASKFAVVQQSRQKMIEWGKFLGNDGPWDLRKICAMYYASEQVVSANVPAKVQHVEEWVALRQRAEEFIEVWAERFGKYTFAACLGEFRHRHHGEGPEWLVPRGGDRSAAQGVAEKLWPDEEKVIAAASLMLTYFPDQHYFGANPGGPKWAKIAKTFFQWMTSVIPDVVWVDYVWDLSHNGGVFFNKCNLFHQESATRNLLTLKSRAARRDVRTWGKEWLHADWIAGLELLDIAMLPGPEEA